MASPRVFVSSTCYDLSEVRDSLVDFIRSFGFEPVLSDRGDVFYHPDIHTHNSCLNEIGNCQLLILIIGGRFGGKYIADENRSIVNAEYSAARDQKIPVFTFVKRNVYSDHFVYSKNRKNDQLGKIIFPSIEGNKNADRIFQFIDEVRSSDVNNGFFSFDFARDITELLRKQWSGMFFEFLQERSANDQLRANQNLLNSISIAGDKVEELVKRLYRHIDSAGAEATIADVEDRLLAKHFYENLLKYTVGNSDTQIDPKVDLGEHEYWYEYLAAAIGGTVDRSSPHGLIRVVGTNNVKKIVVDDTEESRTVSLRNQDLFETVRGFSLEFRESVIAEISGSDK